MSVIELDISDKINIPSAITQDIDDFATFGIGSGVKNVANAVLSETEQKIKEMVDSIVKIVEDLLDQIISGAVDNIYKAMGINEETMNTVKGFLQLAKNGTSLISSGIFNGLLSLNNFNTMDLPMSAAVAGLSIAASVADILFKKYIEKYSEVINTLIDLSANVDQIPEVLMNIVYQVINQIEDFIDAQVYKYLGYHLMEIYTYCAEGYNKFKAWIRAKKELAKAIREREKQEQGKQTRIGVDTSVEVNVAVDANAIKQQMLDWLNQQGDALYNAFMILQIMDAIKSVQSTVQNLMDINLETLTDNMNNLDDIINLLDDLGLGDDSTAIDLSMIPSLNINAMMGAMNDLKNNVATIAQDAALTAAVAAKSNTGLSLSGSVSKTYDISTDHINKIITFNIYQNPTSSSLAKDIFKILTGTKNEKGKNMFTNAQCKTVQSAINSLWDSLPDDNKNGETEVDAGQYTFEIKIDTATNNTKSVSTQYGSSGAIEQKKQKEESKKNTENNLNDIENEEEPLIIENNAETKVTNASAKISLAVISESFTSEADMEKRLTMQRRNTIQLLHTAFSLLKTIFPILSEIATLISNYRINKAYAAQKSHDNIFALFKEVMDKLGLNKTIDPNVTDNEGRETAMYTVRTYDLYKYCKSELKINIVSSTTAYPIDLKTSEKISEWLDINDPTAEAIPENKNIILFIDFSSINDEKKCIDKINSTKSNISSDTYSKYIASCRSHINGTFNDLDNIEIVDDFIMYSDKNLPNMPSQIVCAKMKGYDPGITFIED